MRKGFLTVIFCVLLTGLLLSGCDLLTGPGDQQGDPDSEYPDLEEKTNQEILTGLGFSLDLGDPEETAETNNPMGTVNKSFLTIHEVYQAGAVFTGETARESLLEYPVEYNPESTGFPHSAADPSDSLSQLLSEPGTDTMIHVKKAAAADMNGDGLDEIVTVFYAVNDDALNFRIIDGKTGLVSTSSLTGLDSVSGVSSIWAFHMYASRDFTAGDFDNDGYDDFAVSFFDTMLILDNELNITGSIKFQEGPYTRVEAGDLNGDGFCDLVLINGMAPGKRGNYYIFAGSADGLGITEGDDPGTASVFHGGLTGTQQYSSGEFAVGDVDGNGLNELVFSGVLTGDDSKCHITLIDPYNETSGEFQGTELLTSSYQLIQGLWGNYSHHHMNYRVPRVVTGDFDGDGTDELNVMDKTFKYADGSLTPFAKGVFNTPNEDTWRRNDMFYDLAAAGDITGDGCDDLVFFETADMSDYWDSTKSNIDAFTIWGKNSAGEYVQFYRIGVNANKTFPTVVLANTDTDSLVIKYQDRELRFGEPSILAVLASPPYNEHMNIDNSGTSYSIKSGKEDSWEFNNGFNVGVAVGFKVEISLPVCDVLSIGGGRSVAVENEFAWGYGESVSSSLDYGYSADAGNNMVIVTAVPIDMYIYEIVSGPDPDSVGEYMTINVPREPEQLFLTVDFYNKSVKEKDRIPEDLITHTIGDPFSYYSKNDMLGFAADEAGVFYSGAAKVPQGSAQTSISYEEDKTGFDTYEYSLTASHTYSYRLLFGEAELTTGFNHGYACQHSISEGFSIEGVVGSIEDEDKWSETAFTWGMMMIPRQFNDQSFSLVTYWVEREN